MRKMLLSTGLVTMVAVTPAAALTLPGEGGRDCESSPKGHGGGCDPTPHPTLPTERAGKSGDYRVAIDTRGNSCDGYVRNRDDLFRRPPLSPDQRRRNANGRHPAVDGHADRRGHAEATAFAPASADQGYSAQGGSLAGYLVELYAANSAALALLQPLLTTSGAIAHIFGSYTLTQSGQSFSIASAHTGMNVSLAQNLQRSTGTICDRSGYYSLTGTGCGTFDYALDLNFVPGATYTNGNPLSLYGSISVRASVHAEATVIRRYAGLATAFSSTPRSR